MEVNWTDTVSMGSEDDAYKDIERLYQFVISDDDKEPEIDIRDTLALAVIIDIERQSFWVALTVLTILHDHRDLLLAIGLPEYELDSQLDLVMGALQYNDPETAYYMLSLVLIVIEQAGKESESANNDGNGIEAIVLGRSLFAVLNADPDLLTHVLTDINSDIGDEET